MSKSSLTSQLFLLHLIVFLTFLGLALPYSIFPIIFIGNNDESNILIYSFIISTYPIGQALGMMLFGHFSDIYGRKKILQYTLIGALITFIISGLCITYEYYITLIFIRFFCGMFEGNSAIALAAVNDLQQKLGNKLKWFGMINIALTLGFMVGPILGSIFSNHNFISWFDFSIPFYVAALISFITFIAISVFFKETHIQPSINTFQLQNFCKDINKTFNNVVICIKRPGLNKLLILSLVVTTSVEVVYQFIPVYLAAEWKATPIILAMASFILSVGKILGNGYLLNLMYKCFRSSFAGICLGLLGVIFCLINLINSQSLFFFMAAILLLGVFISFAITNCITLISNYTSKNKQGGVLGTAQSLRLICGTIMCNIAAISCQINFKMPFFISIFFALIALPLFMSLMKRKSRSENRFYNIASQKNNV